MKELEGFESDEGSCIPSCISTCEKDIYPTGRMESETGVDIVNGSFDQPVSFGDAIAAREMGLENILSTPEFQFENSLMYKKLPFKSLFASDCWKTEQKKILESVTTYNLSDRVKDFAKDYEKFFGVRDNFLWKWLGALYKKAGVTLSTVDPKYHDSVTEDKILLTMLFSILDDVSEFYKDEELLEKLLGILKDNVDSREIQKNDKLSFFKKLWDHFSDALTKYPRYEEFIDIFKYDFNQMMNSVSFSYLVNKKPELINLHEMEIYDCHNMIVFLLNGIDLMASPNFDKNDLPNMRTIFWNAQQMARIGNWLSTWKREIKEKDLCSGIVAYALSKKILTIDDMNKLSEKEIIQKIEDSNVYDYFGNSWKKNYAKIKSQKETIDSVDINAYILGLKNVFKFHMASIGLK